MSGASIVAGVSAIVRETAAAMEGRFLHAGTALESAVGILSRLCGGFEAMEQALRGGALAGAHAQLSRAAELVAAMGRAGDNEDGSLGQLAREGAAIAACTGRLAIQLATMKVLAVNARIAAAGINVPGTDFMEFAADIARTVATTQASLDAFTAGLGAVRSRLVAAQAGRDRLAGRKASVARAVPERLVATAALIGDQHARAALASATAREHGARTRAAVCNAIVALQIGDATRQRLEHVDAALALLDAAPPAAVAAVITLQSAQLADTGREFEHEATAIGAGLAGLGADLRALHELGQAAYGSPQRGRGQFIAELERQISAARGLLVEFSTARDEAEAVRAAVVEATTALAAHLRKVRSCETDLRIMGLNTTFKCARAGPDGLMLSCIAQELRGRSTEFARESAQLMTLVETMARIGGEMNGAAREDGALPAAAGALDAAFATLSHIEAMAADAAESLEGETRQAVAMLEQAVAGLAGGGVRGVLDGAVVRLSAGVTAEPADASFPPLGALLETIQRGYTMTSERRIHAGVFGQQAIDQPLELVDDLLF